MHNDDQHDAALVGALSSRPSQHAQYQNANDCITQFLRRLYLKFVGIFTESDDDGDDEDDAHAMSTKKTIKRTSAKAVCVRRQPTKESELQLKLELAETKLELEIMKHDKLKEDHRNALQDFDWTREHCTEQELWIERLQRDKKTLCSNIERLLNRAEDTQAAMASPPR